VNIVQVMPNFGVGGAEIMCENLIYELLRLGHKVTAISLFNFHSVISERLEKHGVDVRFLDKRLGFDLSIPRKVRKILKEIQPDVVHTHRGSSFYAMLPAISLGVPARVHTLHSVAQKENTKLGIQMNKLLFKRQRVTPVALSNAVRDTVAEVYGVDLDKIPVIYNGVDLSNCMPKDNYNVNGIFKILNVGRLSYPKNQVGLVNAFKIFHEKHLDSELWIIGEGEERKAIEGVIKQYGLDDSVKMLGQQNDVFPFLHDADVFALPSIYEGVPMSLIEAMGTGLPIVATSVGGIPDMLQNGKEAILTNNDVDAIANAFETYFSSFELRKKYGEQAKLRAIDFSSANMAKSYVKIYESLINGK
jgi:glycosyltransferase involved in cell wall biosynthesis